ncbi:MAG: P-loop NTPase family protein [Rhodocyclaceae bacterium]
MSARLHVMILGQTLSGKSTLAKMLAQQYMDAGTGVILYDPIGDLSWPCHLRTDSDSELLELMDTNSDCAVFIDEAAEIMGRGDKRNWRIATRGRHNGHRAHFISQRSFDSLAPIVRGQCSDLFLFNISFDDAKKIAREWNTDGSDRKMEIGNLVDIAPNLPPGKCIRIARHKRPELITVFEAGK